MSKTSYGAFFGTAVYSTEVIEFLRQRYALETVEKNSKSLKLVGVCDSRIGGCRQLVFCNLKNYSTTQGLTESLILIDEMPNDHIESSNQFFVLADPRAAFIDTLEWLISSVGIDAHTVGFSERSSISPETCIAPTAVIESGVEIGSGCEIGAGAVIKSGSRIGKNTVIRENVVIGCDGITVHRAEDGRVLKFPHLAGVCIGDNTEVGSNTVIAGGILSPTIVSNNVVIGNLCNIGHGVKIENNVWMSVGTLIGGHTTIQSGATLAMGVSVRDNLVIGEEASIGMGSVVVKDVSPRHSMFGNPSKRMPSLKAGPKR
jgi:UDP-3-O-[3-hydroxymyristoyl] glucosamine N-acyltransferase